MLNMKNSIKSFQNLLIFSHILFSIYGHCENIHLEKISDLYVPFSYTEAGTPVFTLVGGAAEQLAYDPQDKIVYIVGASKLNVIDISDVHKPIILFHEILGDFDPTDVEFCGDHVFVALDNNQNREAGRVIVFKKYDKKYDTMEAVLNITVGPLPDMLLPSSHCSTVLIALEAEAFARDGKLVDPEGGVGLLKFHGQNISASYYSYKRLNFHNFNDRWSDLSKSGVRFIYKENNNTFSQDVEPEYITYSKDERKAYICLQENNAIAEIDLETENITAIHGLGFKDWRNSKLDASDKDNGIHIRPLPVMGMYQPDSIHVIDFKNAEYLIMANEGDIKDYSEYPLHKTGFSEVVQAKEIMLSNNSDVLRWAKENNVRNIMGDSILGRLQITKENGRLPDGTFDKLYTFGGRGFSIWRANTMTKVYDSGSDVEDTISQSRPDLFNADAKKIHEVVKKTMDSRSDDKGPESESIAIVHEGNRIIVFLGNERPGSISIYSFNGDMFRPHFESVFWNIPNSEVTWTEAFDEQTISCIDPEDIKYVPPHQSPSGRPLLLVAGSVSGTLSILEVKGVHIPIHDVNIAARGVVNFMNV